MAYNRELSQFASLVEVNDTSKRIGVSTDLRISGVVTANYFYGDGRYLTDIVASFVPSGPTRSIQLNNGGYPAGANNFFYDTGTDNVGIGISLPTSKFHVTGTSLFTGISTFTNTTFFTQNPVIIGTATSTGTASQPLQVVGSAYVSSRIGVGVTNQQQNTRVAIAGTLGLSEFGGTGDRTLIQSTTSGLIINHNDSQDIIFQTGSVNRFRWRHASSALLIAADTPTGTSGQVLQVAGGTYIRDNLGIGFPTPTSKVYIQGDTYTTGVSTSGNHNTTGEYRVNNTTVITSGRDLRNIASGAIIGINSNGSYIGAGTTTLDFVGAGASVRYNQLGNKIEVALRDDGIIGSHVKDAQDIFGWIPFEQTITANITLGNENTGISSSYVTVSSKKLIISDGASLTVGENKVVLINTLLF